MELDHDICYRAIRSRDSRFDGRFFTGVTSTGIYCRPICPARTPKKENVRFFACAAAAENAGFRACRRCRPEVAPWTSAWSGTGATVARAWRLIGEGALDAGNVETLAARLGVSSRQLRRLFLEHLGVTPIAVAQSRRLQLARSLIEGSSLPISEIALAAGFSSLRRFHALIHETWGIKPSAMRQKIRAVSDAWIEISLPSRDPFDAEGVLRFLSLRATPGVESVTDCSYRRTFAAGGERGIVEVLWQPASGLLLRVPIALGIHVNHLVGAARRLFDLAADPETIGSHLAEDPLLEPLVRKNPGIRVPGAWNPFEVAVRAIAGQQVSVAAATTLMGRLVQRCGEALAVREGELWSIFPTPERLAATDLRGIGFPDRRASAINALAAAVADRRIDFEARRIEETIAALRELPGVGPWTAGYVAMRALGEPGRVSGRRSGSAAADRRGRRPRERERADSQSRGLAPLAILCGDAVVEKRIVSGATYAWMESPIGTLLVAGGGGGVVAVRFEAHGEPAEPDDGWTWDDASVGDAMMQLREYFAGQRREFTLPLNPEGTGFQREVWMALRAIPYGQTRSYGEIAREIGRPKAVRAVGAANGANPIPIIVPCHRVIGADGSLTGFGGGLPAKRFLLEMERRAAVPTLF